MGIRNVRNFWVEVDHNTIQRPVATGPRNAEGGIDITLYNRKEGGVDYDNILEIRGRVKHDGSLVVTIYHGNKEIYSYSAER